MFKNPVVRKDFNDQFYSYTVKISAGYAYYWFCTCTHVTCFPGKNKKKDSATVNHLFRMQKEIPQLSPGKTVFIFLQLCV